MEIIKSSPPQERLSLGSIYDVGAINVKFLNQKILKKL
jgi:hypothetical protein